MVAILYILIHTAVVSIPSVMVMEHYGADNVTVILEWTKQQHISYNITIMPNAVVQESSENTRLRAQLTVAYNIMYSVKFEATLCGQNVTEDFEFLHGEHFYVTHEAPFI